MKLLLVEDHRQIADIIFEYFEIKGFAMDYAADGRHGLSLAEIEIDRKVLADIAVHDPAGFAAIAEAAKESLAA